jgi:hypothetical protein
MTEPFKNECCTDMVEMKQWRILTDQILVEMKSDVKAIRESLANRLPLWATLAISILAAAVGWFAK